MVDSRGRVTTGLLSGLRFIKDNRLLPRGFEKSTAEPDIAVRGAASDDADFQAPGDEVLSRVALDGRPGPYTVRAELWYQTISYRWAHNLAGRRAEETDRFVGYYQAMSDSSATVLARAAVEVP